MSLSQTQSMQATLMNIAQINPAQKNQATAQEFNNQDFFNILNQQKSAQAANPANPAGNTKAPNQQQAAAADASAQKEATAAEAAKPAEPAKPIAGTQQTQQNQPAQAQHSAQNDAASDTPSMAQLSEEESRDLQEANELLSSLAGILAHNQAAATVTPTVAQTPSDKPLEVLAVDELTLEAEDPFQHAARQSLENMGEQLNDDAAQQNLDPEAFEQVQNLKKDNLTAGNLADTVKTAAETSDDAQVTLSAASATTTTDAAKNKANEDIFRQNLAPQQAAKPELSSILEAKLQPVGDEKGVSMTAATTLATNAQASAAANAKLEAALPTQQNAALPSVQTPMSSPKWSQEIAQNLMIMASRRLDMAQMAITPAHLGPINVALKVTQDQASVLFVAATPQAKEALEQNMNKLATMLAENGLQLQDAQVSSGQSQEDRQAAQHAFLMQQQQQNQTAPEHQGEFAALAANMGLPGQAPAVNSTQNTQPNQAPRAPVDDGRVSVFA